MDGFQEREIELEIALTKKTVAALGAFLGRVCFISPTPLREISLDFAGISLDFTHKPGCTSNLLTKYSVFGALWQGWLAGWLAG